MICDHKTILSRWKGMIHLLVFSLIFTSIAPTYLEALPLTVPTQSPTEQAETLVWLDNLIGLEEPDLDFNQIPGIPTELLNEVRTYSSAQTEKFISVLKDVYLNSVKRAYSKYYPGNPVSADQYLENLKQTIRHLQEKEHRFLRRDPVGIKRIGLKIAYINAFGRQSWEDFKVQLNAELILNLVPNEAVKDLTPEQITEREAKFWEILKNRLSKPDQSGANPPRLNDPALMEAFIKRVRTFGEILSNHPPKAPPFAIGLTINHLLTFSRWENPDLDQALLNTDVWKSFSDSANKLYSETSTEVSLKFLEEVGITKLRELTGAGAQIESRVIASKGTNHLVAQIHYPEAAADIVVINPPHSLANGGLAYNDRALTDWLILQKRNIVVVDFRDGQFKIVRVLKRKAWWNPVQFLRTVWAGYENPTTGSILLAVFSILFNVYLIRYPQLKHAAETQPDKVQFSWPAIYLISAYFIFCSAFGRWYDNSISHRNIWVETGKKTLFAFWFTTFGWMALTSKLSIWKSLGLALIIGPLEKLGSTFDRRLIRFLEKEGIIKVDKPWMLRSSEVSPALLAELVRAYRAEEDALNAEIREKELKGLTANHLPSTPGAFSLQERLEMMDAEVYEEADLEEIMPDELSAEDAEELLAYANQAEDVRELKDSLSVEDVQNQRRAGSARFKLDKGLVAREAISYLRNAAVSVGTTGNAATGIGFQIVLGELSNSVALALAKTRLKRYRLEGNEAQVKYFESQLGGIYRDIFIIPGLFKLVKSGFRKVAPGMSKLRSGLTGKLRTICSKRLDFFKIRLGSKEPPKNGESPNSF